MNSKEMNELFYGKELTEKQEQFKKELDQIEKKHIEYFQARETDRPQPHDLLHNHYIILTSNGSVMFNFTPGSDLAENIKDECTEAFKRVYPGAKQNPM